MGKGKSGKRPQKKTNPSKQKSSGKAGDPIRGGKIKARHILVDKLSKAQEISEDLKAGEKFEKLAQTYSTCSSKKRGGNLGEFAKGDMVREFWDACVKLKIGEISQPIKTQYGYHIIKRLG